LVANGFHGKTAKVERCAGNTSKPQRQLVPPPKQPEPEPQKFPHVDDYIWCPFGAPNPYAQWMLMHFRLPAVQQMRWAPFIGAHRLFCSHEGKRYRVTGASRLGDVYLASDFDRDCGYDTRARVDACSQWGAQP
jgi:hypothetical protein